MELEMQDNEIFANLISALDDYAKEVEDLYKKRLMSDDKKASGKLIDSIKGMVAYNNIYYTVFLELAGYWKYVEEGLRGGKNSTSPFPAPAWKKSYPHILNWIKVKKIKGRPLTLKSGKTKLPTETQLAAMISKGIEKNGIKAGGQLRDTVQAVNAYYMPILQEALERDFNAYSMKVFERINRMVKI